MESSVAPLVVMSPHPATARLLQGLLATSGLELPAKVVDDVAEARRLLEQPVSCLLVDVDGFGDDARRLLSGVIDAAYDVPVVALTGVTDDTIGTETVAAGAQDWLAKDRLDPRLLAHAVRNAIERRQREHAARQADDWLRALLANSTDLIAVLDAQMTVRYANPATDRLLGFSLSGAPGGAVLQAIDPSDIGRLTAAYEQIRDTPGVNVPMEFRVRRPDGEWRMLEVVANNRFDDPIVAGIVFNGRDVTERLRTEAALRSSEKSLAEAQRIAHLGSWELRVSDRTAQWSAEMYRIFGVDQAAAEPGQRFYGALHADDRPEVVRKIEDSIASRRPYSIDHRVVLPDGRIRYVHERGIFVDGDRPGSERLVGTAQDITAKKRAELSQAHMTRALRTLSRCNQSLVHASDEAELLDEMCRTVVEAGGYKFAWVGFADNDVQRTVRPMATAGDATGYVTEIRVGWGDDEYGRGPVGTAIRTGTVQVIDDLGRDPAFALWRPSAERFGFRSAVSLPLQADGAVIGALAIYAEEPGVFDEASVSILSELAADLSYGISRLRDTERLNKSMAATIDAVAATVEIRDPYTAGHQRRVGDLAAAIAERMGLTEHDVRGVRVAGGIHDIGKIYVPAEILARPGRLTAEEFALIRRHPEVGYEIMKPVQFPWPVAEMIRQHHERLNGSGYPDGLQGDDILVGARILAVADAVEAISHFRPYRPPLGLDTALAELRAGRGVLYDAEVVDATLALFHEGFTLGQ